MKFICSALVLISFSVQASPILSMKDRLRLHMWINGLELERPVKSEKLQKKPLPEEIERALRKM